MDPDVVIQLSLQGKWLIHYIVFLSKPSINYIENKDNDSEKKMRKLNSDCRPIGNYVIILLTIIWSFIRYNTEKLR